MPIETLSMHMEDDEEAGYRVLTLSGPLVLKTMFEFQDLVRGDNPHHMILDLSGVEYMDSAGLGAILGAYASYQRHGKHFGLVGVNKRVFTLLEVTHTDQFLQRFATLEEAKRKRS